MEESVHIMFIEAGDINKSNTPDDDDEESRNLIKVLDQQNEIDDNADSQGLELGPEDKNGVDQQNNDTL